MPEFRFRRKKKHSSRRHTLHDPEEAHAQVVAAKEMVKREEASMRTRSPSLNDIPVSGTMATQEGGHIVSTGTLAREREKFFDLLKSKYPEHGQGIEDFLSGSDRVADTGSLYSRSRSADIETMLPVDRGEERRGERPWSKRERERRREREEERDSLSSSDARDASESESPHYHHSGCFFLRHGTELRRCPIPSPVTLSTLKILIVNTFDLQPSLLDDPMCYVMIQDRGSMRWKPLTDIRDIYDHCILQLADPDASITNPTHFLPDDHPHLSSESPPPIIAGNHHTITPPHSAHPLHHSDHQSHTSPQITTPANSTNSFSTLWQSDTTAIPISPPHPPTVTPHTHSTHTTSKFGSPYSVTSSTSGVCSEPLQLSMSSHRLRGQVRELKRSIQDLREDYETYRKEQLADITDFSLCMRDTALKITSVIQSRMRIAVLERDVKVEPFRRQRLELTADREAYSKSSSETLLELSILEAAVEDIRRDVVDRRCRVHDREVDGLINGVETTTKALSHTRDQYGPLEAKLRGVMEKELTNIIQEENFLEEEGPRLEAAREKCQKLKATLETLKQVASVQYHRTPLVPYFPPVPNPDRSTLMENIRAVTPNHLHRLESIEMALCVQNKKKELVMNREGMKRFESQLRVQKDHLHKMDSISRLEDKQEKKMIALYMEEKAQREEQLEREMEWVKKAAERKREEEREKVKERLVKKQKNDDKRRKSKQQNKRFEVEREENSESFCGDEDEDSLMLSSFSSAASLLEHVKSLSEWSSDTQQEKSEGDKTEQSEMLKLVSDDEPKQWGERGAADSRHTSGKSRSNQNHLPTAQKKYAPSEPVQTHSNGLKKFPPMDFKDSNGLVAHSPPPLKVANKTRERQQKVSQPPLQPRTTSQHKGQHRGNGPVHSNPRQVKTHKPDTTKHTHSMKTKGSIQSPPGLQMLNPIFQSSASQDTPPRTSRFGYHKPAIQKIVQPIKQLVVEHKTSSRGAHPERVRVRGSNRHQVPRRVSSSDALLEEPSSRGTSHYYPPHQGKRTLDNTPPTVRKSTGYLGEFDSTGHYDVLEARATADLSKSLAPQHRHESLPAVNGHSGIGSLQMPTFPDTRAVSDVGVQSSKRNDPSISSSSQPDSFEFSSNPSYETRSEIKEGIEKHKSSKRETVKQSGTKNPSGGIHNGHPVQTQGLQSRVPLHEHQFTPTQRPNSVSGGPIIHHSYTKVAMKSGKPVNVKPSQNHHPNLKIQPGFGSSNNPCHSESENSQNTERVHSVLSNISSTHHSVVSTASGQQSHSSAFSRRSGIATGYKVHTEKPSSKPPSVSSNNSRSVHGDSRKSTSGLPVPRRRYRSETQSQVEVSRHRGHRRPAPSVPSHRHSTHEQSTLTSYPRFQSREDHRERLQETRGHKSKQFSVLPGTGQLAQFPKPVTDHKGTRNQGVGSLV